MGIIRVLTLVAGVAYKRNKLCATTGKQSTEVPRNLQAQCVAKSVSDGYEQE